MYATDARHPNETLAGKLAHLYTLRGGPGNIDLSIRPAYYELLARLGNPHSKLPPVIHVAGTNGKGSTVAYMRAILEATGKRVHVYTSPHLRVFNERIRLAGDLIADSYMEELLDEVTELAAGLQLTFFEITTAMAFAAFARNPADYLLLETGLGGRLDCTNVVEKPVATLITAIGIDHCEYLGDTVEKIAAEKSGIMKEAAPCFIAPQGSSEVIPVFEDHAKRASCPLYRAGKDWSFAVHDTSWTYNDARGEITLPLPALTGTHQPANASAAIACLRRIIPDLSDDSIRRGLRSVQWPGRLQKLRDGTPELWVDGGHNAHAANVLALQAAKWQKDDGKKLHVVLGMMKTKDPAAFIAPLRPYICTLTAVQVPDEPLAHDAATIAKLLNAKEGKNLPQAVADIKDGRILITGSLYLTGLALGLFSPPSS